uniref:Uncharacterized protein n=1 Tax=Oryctolagus cuniculus TaxID=9986 RepID=A0A5F9D7T7_RABIT
MSSHSGASGFSDGSGPEREEQTAAGGGGASRAAAAGLVWGPAGSGEGQPRCEGGGDGGPSSVQAPKWQLASDRGAEVQPQMAQAGAGVLWGAEGPPGTPVLEGEGTGAPASQVAEGCAGPERPLSGPGDGARRRLPSAEAAAILARVEAGGGGRGVLGASCEEFLQACAAPLQVSARREGRAEARSEMGGGSPRGQRAYGEGPEGLSSGSEASSELEDVQPRRGSIRLKAGGQAKGSSSEVLAESPRHATPHSREQFAPTPGPPRTSARGPTCHPERPAAGELGPSASKKMQGEVSGKAGARPRHPGAAAAAARAGGCSQATPRRKVTQENPPGVAPEVGPGAAFAPWLQRQATAPREAAGLLPFCTSLLGKPSTAFPWGRKPSKQGGAGKKAQARRKSQAVETRESGAKRDPVPGAHFLSSRPPTSYQHRGEFSSGVPTPQEVRALRNLQSLLQSSGAVPPRGRARSGTFSRVHSGN